MMLLPAITITRCRYDDDPHVVYTFIGAYPAGAAPRDRVGYRVVWQCAPERCEGGVPRGCPCGRALGDVARRMHGYAPDTMRTSTIGELARAQGFRGTPDAVQRPIRANYVAVVDDPSRGYIASPVVEYKAAGPYAVIATANGVPEHEVEAAVARLSREIKRRAGR